MREGENGFTPNPGNQEERQEQVRDLSKLNYYEILEVPRNATPEEISAAFRKLSTQLHPDKKPDQQVFGGYTEFQWVAEAYNHLKNPSLRRRYDARLDYEQSAPHGDQGFSGSDFNSEDFIRDFEARSRATHKQTARTPRAEVDPIEDIEAQIAYVEQRAEENILYHQGRRDEDIAYYTGELNEINRYTQSEIAGLNYNYQGVMQGLRHDKDQALRSIEYNLTISQQDTFSSDREKASQREYYERQKRQQTEYYDRQMAQKKAYCERKIAEQKAYAKRKTTEFKQAIERAKSAFEETKKRILEHKKRRVKALKEKLKAQKGKAKDSGSTDKGQSEKKR